MTAAERFEQLARLAGMQTSRVSRHVMTFDFHDLDPHQTVTVWKKPGVPFRPMRIDTTVHARPPNIRWFQPSTGGSKRRGRRASWLWAAEMLVHRRHAAQVTLDALTIDGEHGPRQHLVATAPFDRLSQLGDLILGVCVAHGDITMRITNHERYRSVGGVVTMSGASCD